MTKRIVQLPAVIANQIAAGEVIERPASVVKELLENSFDAGANLIHIEIAYGGLNQIKISDNGSGILAEDLPLAISAHATSKITRLDDLYAISSMGFRGEALASIASISKLSISSKPEQQAHAMMLSIQGEQQELAACARTTGTTIDVRDLFFNAPVRKRFLKTERLEFQAIESVVKRFALSAPHIALNLSHNDKLVFSLPSALNEQAQQMRMTKILGSAFMANAIYLDVEQSSMRLEGWISGKEHQRSQNDRQWVYINQRMVKDKLLNHAIKQAYEGLLHPGRFPSCLLYLTMNTKEIDVNVHPTKHEVRFQQPRLVHDFFITQCTKALATETTTLVSSTALCEPSPQFSHHLTPLKSMIKEAAFSSTRPVNSFVEEGLSWTVLNKQFSLLWLEQQPYLVNVLSLYQAWFREQLQAQTYPLASRPLLVAVRYPIANQLKAIDSLQALLLTLGIKIDVQAEDILLRSIPVCSPYLDLKSFCESLIHLDNCSLERVQSLLVEAQLIDSSQLNAEERINLGHYLLEIQKEKRINFAAYKPFTIEDCRMLLDA